MEPRLIWCALVMIRLLAACRNTSVSSRAVGRPVEIQAYADRIVIRQDGAIVGEHPRCFGRGETI